MTEAAAALGVSVPTVRQMVACGQLVAFRTPGGHLRFTADSVRAAKGESLPALAGLVPSRPLQNRRERVEDLNLEAKELRAERQLGALRREQEEEEADRRAEAEALGRNERTRLGLWWWTDNGSNVRKPKNASGTVRQRKRNSKRAVRFLMAGSRFGVDPPGCSCRGPARRGKQGGGVPAGMPSHPGNADIATGSATVADALAPWQREQEIAAIIEDVRQMLPFTARGLSWSPTVWDLKAKQAAFTSIVELRDSGSLEQIRTAARLAVKDVLEQYQDHERAEKTARRKAQFLDNWFLCVELTDFVGRLLHEDAIELDAGERLEDVVDSLKAATRKYLDQQLTGSETREEV